MKNKRSKMAVHYSTKKIDWSTPRDFYAGLHRQHRFTLDPCATHGNAVCPRHFTRKENGLKQDWGRHRVFMNPPYGREIGLWMRKAHDSSCGGALVVCLVPARTDTAWWHDYAARGSVAFIRGRLKFGGAKNGAPFPSAIVIFRPKQP